MRFVKDICDYLNILGRGSVIDKVLYKFGRNKICRRGVMRNRLKRLNALVPSNFCGPGSWMRLSKKNVPSGAFRFFAFFRFRDTVHPVKIFAKLVTSDWL